MAQTTIDITKLKDRDTASAFNVVGDVFEGTTPAPSSAFGTAAHKLTLSAATNLTKAVASGTDTNIDISLQPQASGVIALAGTTVANASVQVPTVSSSVNFVQLQGAATGNGPILTATGTDSNVALHLRTKGTGITYVGGASAATAGIQVAATASAVNQLVVTNAATGNALALSIGGSGADSNPALSVQAKGTGAIHLGGTGTTDSSVQVATVASAVNKVVLTPTVTGSAPTIACGGAGADANRNLLLQGNGTGGAHIKGRADAAGVPAGYVGEVIGDMVFGTGTTATVTITIASPGVITWTAHGFSTAIPQPVVFTTSGALPTGITSGTVYYTVPSSVTTNTFQIATTIANAIAGTSINTSGTQSGTQTGTAGASQANTTAIDITGLALTAGVWRVWAHIQWNANAATTWTKMECSISQTSATLATPGAVRGSTYGVMAQISAAATNGVTSFSTGSSYINVSSTTNIFLVVKSAFATNTLGSYGYLFAERIG